MCTHFDGTRPGAVCSVCDAAHTGPRVRWSHSHCIQTAPGPMMLFEGARYSMGFAVEVGSDKYDEHMPLERQVRSMAHDGLIIDSQTLWDQIYALTRVLRPRYDALLQYNWA